MSIYEELIAAIDALPVVPDVKWEFHKNVWTPPGMVYVVRTGCQPPIMVLCGVDISAEQQAVAVADFLKHERGEIVPETPND